MFDWDLLVDALRAVIVVLTHLFGGSVGSAIITVSLVARVLLLPFTLRLALRARDIQRRMGALEPELARLRKRFERDPMELLRRTQALREQHGIPVAPRGTLAFNLVQLPLGGALYQSIRTGLGQGNRFLWVADLARPDALLSLVVALLTTGAVLAAAPQSGANGASAPYAAAIMSGAVMLLIAWRLTSGVGLYWAASNVVGVVQGILVRRADARATAA